MTQNKHIYENVASMAVERTTSYWNGLELKIQNLKDQWESVVDKEPEDLFSMGLHLDASLERKCSGGLKLAGPLVDHYIKEIGGGMLNKLRRGKSTGIQTTNKISIPWQIMTNLMKLIKGYGGEVHVETKRKEKLLTISIPSESCACKIWYPMRCGRNILSKRHYAKKPTEIDGIKKQKFVYSGVSKVVVTERTPITITFYTKTQRATTTFYVQRYDENNFVLDAALQSTMNYTAE